MYPLLFALCALTLSPLLTCSAAALHEPQLCAWSLNQFKAELAHLADTYGTEPEGSPTTHAVTLRDYPQLASFFAFCSMHAAANCPKHLLTVGSFPEKYGCTRTIGDASGYATPPLYVTNDHQLKRYALPAAAADPTAPESPLNLFRIVPHPSSSRFCDGHRVYLPREALAAINGALADGSFDPNCLTEQTLKHIFDSVTGTYRTHTSRGHLVCDVHIISAIIIAEIVLYLLCYAFRTDSPVTPETLNVLRLAGIVTCAVNCWTHMLYAAAIPDEAASRHAAALAAHTAEYLTINV